MDSLSADDMRAYRGTLTEQGVIRHTAIAASKKPATVPRHARRQVRRWCPCARRSTWPRPTSTCATRRCIASSAAITIAWATPYAFTRCTPMRTRWKMRWRTSRTRSARWSSKTSGRFTIGCWSICDAGMFADPLPRQHEFSRLNVTYVITSKRNLNQLVVEKHVEGWDDPRMPPSQAQCASAATARGAAPVCRTRHPKCQAGSTTGLV